VVNLFQKKDLGIFLEKKRTLQMNEPFTFCMLAKFGTKPEHKRFGETNTSEQRETNTENI